MTFAEPLLPLVVLSAFFIVFLPLFALHVRRHGLPRDATIEGRKVGPLLGRYLMYYLLWLIAPVEAFESEVEGVLDRTPMEYVFVSISLHVWVRVAPGQAELDFVNRGYTSLYFDWAAEA